MRMHEHRLYRHLIALITVVVIGTALAACGRGRQGEAGSTSQSPTRAVTAVPTMPVARFAQPTTAITPAAAASEGTPTASPAEADLRRGQTIYTNKECASCHGAQGEGVAGKGKALAGAELTYQEFEDILRTGGAGELGPDHLYGTMAISPSGMEALYAFIQSLGGE